MPQVEDPPHSYNARELMVAATAFAAITVFVTWPQITTLSTHVGDHYDALFSMWRLGWFARQLRSDPLDLFNANIFYPELNTFAYSDAMLLLGLAGAPFIWAGVSVSTVYNVLVLLSFVTAATAMYALIKAVTGSIAAAWLAALTFAFQPYRYAHFPQIELLWTCFISLALLAVHRLFDRPTLAGAIALGVAVGGQVWTCIYYAVFLVTGLAVYAPIRWMTAGRPSLPRLAPLVAVAIGVTALFVLPYAIPYWSVSQTAGHRTLEEVRAWSPPLQNYFASLPSGRYYNLIPQHLSLLEGVLYPGAFALGLALLGAVTGGRRAIAIVAMLALTFDLSRGLNGWLYELTRELLVPYRGLRVPARMFVMVSAALSMLAGLAVARLLAGTTLPKRVLATAILSAGVVLETLVTPIGLQPVPPLPPKVYAFLAAQPPTVIFEWPMPHPSDLGATRDPEAMYFSLFHPHRIVNGYSGHHPPSFIQMSEQMQRFPDDVSLLYLRRRDVRYIVLHSAFYPSGYATVVNQLAQFPELETVMLERVERGEVLLLRIRGQ